MMVVRKSHSLQMIDLFEIGARAHEEGTIGVLAGQLGLIAQYARDYPDIPYLVKLNSKSHMVKTAQRDPVSQALWDLDDVSSLLAQRNQRSWNWLHGIHWFRI